MKESVHTCIVHGKKWTYTFESASRVAGVWQGLNDPANHNVDAIAAESCSLGTNGVLGTPVIHHLLRIADRRLPYPTGSPISNHRYLTYHCRDTLRRDCQSTYKFTFMTQRRLVRNAILTSTSISNVTALYQVLVNHILNTAAECTRSDSITPTFPFRTPGRACYLPDCAHKTDAQSFAQPRD